MVMPASCQRIRSLNVRAFGAVGDGLTDDTRAIQAAIDTAGVHGGGVVMFPRGDYLVRPQTLGGTALAIQHNSVTLQGVSRSASRITMRPYADIGGDHETTWQVIDGKVWRGVLFTIVGGDPRQDVTFRALTIDGGCQYTGNVAHPADPTTGDGWDITHKGVSLDSRTGSYDRILIEACEIYGFKGEIVYGGGGRIGAVTLRDSDLHDTNGDCWSVSGRCTVIGNHMYRAAHACIEDVIPEGKPSYYARNELSDCSVHHLVSFTGIAGQLNSGPLTFESNYLHDHTGQQSALFMTRVKNVTVRDNLLVDVAPNVNTRAISLDAGGDTSAQVSITGNTITASKQDMNCGILVSNTQSLTGCRIEDNMVSSSGKTVATPYVFPAADAANVRYARNIAQGVEV